MPPLVLSGLDFLAGVFLDRVTGRIVERAEALNQQYLVLPRTHRLQPEQVEAAIGDARLHRPADDMGHEQIRREPHIGRRWNPV
ncbi:MAG: hypothetical protein ABSH37_21845, partial [Bryobacteraceae bacterium]